LGWIICCTVLCGCGPSGPQRVPVRGKVTFDGAPPPGLGTVYFATIKAAEGFPRRPGHGNFQKGDGSFVVTSVKSGDGLVPGTYRVMIECWQRLPDDSGNPGVSYARSDFNPPELEIKVGTRGPIELQYDVPRAP
jgi:hypothetical protein